MGPYANLAYQTEFTTDSNAKRQKIARSFQGLKLINGAKNITDFHLAMVEEVDFTYNDSK